MIRDKFGFLKNIGQEEIASKQPRYWNEIINRHNDLVRKVSCLERTIGEKDGEIAKLANELRLKSNLLKTYDKKVVELIVECHIVTKIKGRWEYSYETPDDEISEIDFIEKSAETKRIVVRDWDVYMPEYNPAYNGGYSEEFHILNWNGNFFDKKYCDTSKGPVFWWIDIDGEEQKMVDGAIISVKNRDGEILYELSEKEKENLIIGDDQIWEYITEDDATEE